MVEEGHKNGRGDLASGSTCLSVLIRDPFPLTSVLQPHLSPFPMWSAGCSLRASALSPPCAERSPPGPLPERPALYFRSQLEATFSERPLLLTARCIPNAFSGSVLNC